MPAVSLQFKYRTKTQMNLSVVSRYQLGSILAGKLGVRTKTNMEVSRTGWVTTVLDRIAWDVELIKPNLVNISGRKKYDMVTLWLTFRCLVLAEQPSHFFTSSLEIPLNSSGSQPPRSSLRWLILIGANQSLMVDINGYYMVNDG